MESMSALIQSHVVARIIWQVMVPLVVIIVTIAFHESSLALDKLFRVLLLNCLVQKLVANVALTIPEKNATTSMIPHGIKT
jgi:hypothetical protein